MHPPYPAAHPDTHHHHHHHHRHGHHGHGPPQRPMPPPPYNTAGDVPPTHPMYDVMRQRLHDVRSRVKHRIDSVERSLLEDIEEGHVVDAWRAEAHEVYAAPPPPPLTSPNRAPGAAMYTAQVCDVCGGDKNTMTYCPVDGRLHRGNERGLTRFDAARHVLMQEERARAGAPLQPALSPDRGALGLNTYDANVDSGTAPVLEVGGYVVVKDERTVRLQCRESNSPWHDNMAYYCGGGKVGRVVFHKPGCPATDVAFPSGESWLFPTASLVPYNVPSSLSMVQHYSVEDIVNHEDENDAFLKGLRAKVQQRSLAQQISNLQMEYIETYLAVYKEERTSRARLKLAFKEIAEIGLLQRDTANYLRYRQHMGYGQRPPAKTPAQAAHGRIDQPPKGAERHDWSVVGTTRDGHCIIASDDLEDLAAPAPESQRREHLPARTTPAATGHHAPQAQPSEALAWKEALL